MLILGDCNPVRHVSRAYVNYAIIIICIVVFFLNINVTDYALYPAQFTGAAPVPEEVFALPGWLRLVSYAFLHASLLHLAANMIVLWVFGDNIEDSMGHLRYVLFFILCGIGGGLAEAVMTSDQDVPVIGASGAIAGVMAAYLLLHPRATVLILVGYRIPVLVPASLVVGLHVGVDLVMALSGGNGELIAWWAHLGGFATGALLILVMRYRDVALFQPVDIYPETAFPRLRPFVINLTLKRESDTPWPLSLKLIAGIKLVLYFIAITLLVELFIP